MACRIPFSKSPIPRPPFRNEMVRPLPCYIISPGIIKEAQRHSASHHARRFSSALAFFDRFLDLSRGYTCDFFLLAQVMRFFEKLSRRQCTLDILKSRRKCNKKFAGWLHERQSPRFNTKYSTLATFFFAVFSAVASHVYVWLHVRLLPCAGDATIFQKIASPVQTKNRTCSRGFRKRRQCNLPSVTVIARFRVALSLLLKPRPRNFICVRPRIRSRF